MVRKFSLGDQIGQSLVPFLLLCLTASCDIGPTEQEYLQLARIHFAKQEWAASEIELKNVLKHNPARTEARLLLGLVHLETGSGPAAEKELERARDLGASRSDWVPGLAKAFLLSGKYQEALDIPLDDGDPPLVRGSLLASRGFAALGLGRIDEAEATLNRALESAPENHDAILGLSQVALSRQEYAKARSFLDAAVSRNPDSVRAWIMRGGLELAEGKSASALSAFRRVLELNSNNLTGILGVAEAQLQEGRHQKALKTLDSLDKLAPAVPASRFLRGRVLLDLGDLQGARETSLLGLREAPQSVTGKAILGLISYRLENFVEAQEYLTRTLAARPSNLALRKLLAATETRLGRAERAIDVLDVAVDQGIEDRQVMIMLGTAHLNLGHYEQGTKMLNLAATKNVEQVEVARDLGLAALENGRGGHRTTVVDTNVELAEEVLGAEVLLVLAHLQKRKYGDAAAAARELAAKYPTSPHFRNLLGVALAANDDFAGARYSYETALTLQPGFQAALLNLARLDLRAGSLESAKAKLLKILEDDEGSREALLMLSAIANDSGDRDAALAFLEQAWNENQNDPRVGVALVQQYLANQKAPTALRVARQLGRSRHGEDPGVLNALGVALLANAEDEQAILVFEDLVERQPASPEFWRLLAIAQIRLREYEEAFGSLERSLGVDSDYLATLLTRAELEALTRRYQDALTTARQIQEKHPKEPFGYTLEGDISSKFGEFDAALTAYRTAFATAPSGVQALKLSSLQRTSGDIDGSLESLYAWLAIDPADHKVRKQLAVLLHSLNREAQAVKEYERLIVVLPNDAASLNNLAWLYLKHGDPRALETAERAADIAPERADVIDTLGWILVQSRQVDRGLRILEVAVARSPNQPSIRYHLAVAYGKAGRTAKARRTLEDLLSQSVQFPEFAEAQQLLVSLEN